MGADFLQTVGYEETKTRLSQYCELASNVTVLVKISPRLEHRLTNVHHAALSNNVLALNPVPYGYIIQQVRKHTHGVTI